MLQQEPKESFYGSVILSEIGVLTGALRDCGLKNKPSPK